MKEHKMQETDGISTGSKRILLGQLNSYGDCIFATTIARQIKKNYPGCHLTWAIGSMCRPIIDGNPDVDDVWIVPLNKYDEIVEIWSTFEQQAKEKKRAGVFDEVFLTQISPGNLHHYDGSIRSSIFRGYPYPITVPVTPVIRLSSLEIDNVRQFTQSHGLEDKTHIILFETSPQSGQSFLTFDFAKEVANKITATIPNACVILSSNKSFFSDNANIIDASALSLKENAELTKYCTLLVGGSSGISWCCTSDWAKPLPTIQLLNTDTIWFNSLVNDHEQWGLGTDTIIEMKASSINKVYSCIATALLDGFDIAREKYHQQIRTPLGYYRPIINELLSRGEIKNIIKFCILNLKKHGMYPLLLLGPLLAIFYNFLRQFKSILVAIDNRTDR